MTTNHQKQLYIKNQNQCESDWSRY